VGSLFSADKLKTFEFPPKKPSLPKKVAFLLPTESHEENDMLMCPALCVESSPSVTFAAVQYEEQYEVDIREDGGLSAL